MILNNCTVTIGQYVESQTVETQYVDKQVLGDKAMMSDGAMVGDAGCTMHNAQCTMGEGKMPKKNNYKELVDWLEEEKADGRDWYKMNDNNRSAMCRQISKTVGWVVDQNSLRKAGG